MAKYVVIASHGPSECPGASARMGELFGKLMFMFEAPSADALNEYLIESRLADVQEVQLFFGEELHGLIEKTEQLGLQPLY